VAAASTAPWKHTVNGPASELTQHEILAVADELTHDLLERAARDDLLDHRPAQLGPAIQRARLALAANDPTDVDRLDRALSDVATAAIFTLARIRRTA
jgi:hypothetical protein